ncbi:coronin-7-like [Dendronephthya gigantea]|uniref:coronin-7-like n=1 Tax=Dendronephthya gigantea TaxID=151771 RepID=UPI00106A471E|nr:coronin-7-like [Dendronephthya gigantea]
MSRFKTWKYKNATPKNPETQDCIRGIKVGDVDSFGTHIKANSTFLAFNTDGGQGGHLSVLPYQEKEKSQPLVLSSHADFVNDFSFSPFNQSLLATCSKDCSIKIWTIPESHNADDISNPELTLSKQKPVEAVLFNPAAENVLASIAGNDVKIWDISRGKDKISFNEHGDIVQSITWKEDGSQIATGCKDKKIRIIDPRTSVLAQETTAFGGGKETRVQWVGNEDQILATGINKSRQQELGMWDTRNLSTSLKQLPVGSSSGIPMMFYDQDTNMLLLAAKGETSVHFIEVKSNAPHLNPVSTHRVTEQLKGATLIPKLALDVMSGEVLRLMVLTKASIMPIRYRVPRKSYREFHADLFPDTHSWEPAMTSEEWFQGGNTERSKISLDPSKRPVRELKKKDDQPAKVKSQQEKPKPVKSEAAPPPVSSSASKEVNTPTSIKSQPDSGSSDTSATYKRPHKTFLSLYHSKFRHLKGSALHRSQYIENVRNINTSIFGECDGFQCNSKRAAIPLEGPGGKIAVVELANTGRLPETGLPVLENKCTVMDFVMNPFDEETIAVACENGSIKLWKTGADGLKETTDEPNAVLKGHRDRPTIVRYHPTANNILTSASYDLSVNIWDVNKETVALSLGGHLEPLFSFAWKNTGDLLATFSRDQNIRLFDPRASTSSQGLGSGPAGGRGGRIAWAGPYGDWLLVTGFDRSKRRQISLYDSRDLMKELSRVELDNAPSTLIPYMDPDTGVCLLSSKGDTNIFTYEIISEPPHLFELSHIKVPEAHQAVSFLRKTSCNVKEVEFMKALRLTKTYIEPFVVSVPRVQKEYFQDDIFSDTTVTWEPAINAADWLSGGNKEQRKISLRPSGMKLLSEAPKIEVVKKYQSNVELEEYKTDEQKKEELLNAMSGKLTNYDDVPLPQDLTEGVDESEWDD